MEPEAPFAPAAPFPPVTSEPPFAPAAPVMQEYPPQTGYYYADPVYAPPQQAYVRPKRKFLAVFASVLICIFLLSMIFPTFTLFTVRSAMTQETYLSMLKKVELDEVPASVLSSDRSLKNVSLAQYLCDEINGIMGNRLILGTWKDLTPGKLDKVLDESTLLPFLAEHMEGIVEAALNGKKEYKIGAREIEKLLEENYDFLEKDLNLPMQYIEPSVAATYIADYLGVDRITLFTDMDEATEEALSIIRTTLSDYTVAALCIFMILLAVLLVLANRNDPLYALRDVGIVSVISGALLTASMLGSKILIKFFVEEDPSAYFLGIAADTILGKSLLAAVIILAVGIVILILNGIIRKAQKKKAFAAM